MARRAIVILGLLVLLAAPLAQAQIFDEEELTQCALQKAISALTCKPFTEFFFLGKRQGIYIFTGYWAMHYTEFYAQITENNLVLFSSPDWGRGRISAKLAIDYVKGCAEVHVQKSACNSIKDAKCCAKKHPEEAPKAP
jgi:hypothetical protein